MGWLACAVGRLGLSKHSGRSDDLAKLQADELYAWTLRKSRGGEGNVRARSAQEDGRTGFVTGLAAKAANLADSAETVMRIDGTYRT
jgi:hypothetical protein